ncbi:MAG: Ig-like domain-containing protein [Planctomycetota bacterium]|jgi:hypothetical protein
MTVFYGVILAFGLLLPSVPQANDEAPESFILIPETLDFGRVFDGDSPIKEVLIRNQGEESLAIKRVSTTCGCAIPRILFPGGKEVVLNEYNRKRDLGTLQPGEEARMEVSFLTWGYKGKLQKRINVETDAPDLSRRHVTVKAEIVDSIALDPPELDLGEVVRGMRSTGRIRLRSVGIGDFEIKGIRNLPPYLTFHSEKISGGLEAEHWIEIRTREEPPLGAWNLVLQVSVDNQYIDTARFMLRAEVLPKVNFMLGGERIREEIDFGVFSPESGKTVVVDIHNLAPEIPYHPLEVLFEKEEAASLLAHRLETVKPGEQYRLHLSINPGSQAPAFVRGCVIMLSDHPDVLQKKLHLIGWATQAE